MDEASPSAIEGQVLELLARCLSPGKDKGRIPPLWLRQAEES